MWFLLEQYKENEQNENRLVAYEAYKSLSLVQRAGFNDEIAHTVLYLMQNSFTTGNVLFPDGGYTLNYLREKPLIPVDFVANVNIAEISKKMVAFLYYQQVGFRRFIKGIHYNPLILYICKFNRASS